MPSFVGNGFGKPEFSQFNTSLHQRTMLVIWRAVLRSVSCTSPLTLSYYAYPYCRITNSYIGMSKQLFSGNSYFRDNETYSKLHTVDKKTTLRLLNENNEEIQNNISKKEAIKIATEREMNMTVVVNENREPLAFKLLVKSESREQTGNSKIKTIQIRTGTGAGDYLVSLNKVKEHLSSGSTVCVKIISRNSKHKDEEERLKVRTEMTQKVMKDLVDKGQPVHEPTVGTKFTKFLIKPLSS